MRVKHAELTQPRVELTRHFYPRGAQYISFFISAMLKLVVLCVVMSAVAAIYHQGGLVRPFLTHYGGPSGFGAAGGRSYDSIIWHGEHWDLDAGIWF